MRVRSKLPLCAFIGVDKENKSRIIAQALLPNEQTDSFKFALKHLIIICRGHPKVRRFSKTLLRRRTCRLQFLQYFSGEIVSWAAGRAYGTTKHHQAVKRQKTGRRGVVP